MTASPIGAGVLVLDDEEPTAAPAPPEPSGYASTPLGDYDSTAVALARAPFCDRLPEEAVSEALGGGKGRTTTYSNGQRAELTTGVDDVAHEYGCRIVGRHGELRAWIFAPPVTSGLARDLAEEATQRKSCRQPTQAPAYGAPSVALVCPAGARRWASFRGLFGDAWLSCSLAAPASLSDADLLDRAGRWCVAVAEAAAVMPSTG